MVKVQQYIKNLGKSTVYGAAEVLSENFSNVRDFTQTNAEIGKAAYETVKDYRNVFKRVKMGIQNSSVYTAAQVGIKSLVQDITTGDFYNTEREQEIISKYGGSLMDDSIWDMDGDNFSFDDSSLDMSDGEKVVATAIKKNSKISTAIISESVVKSSQAQIDVSRENTALLYAQNERLINKLGGGLDNLTSFLTRNAEQNAKVQNKQIENTNKFFTNMEKNSNRIVAQLDELLEMQRAMYKPQQQESKKKKTSLLDIADGGIPDLKEYANAVKNNLNNQINELTQGMFSMGDAMGGANLLATFASSPMRSLMTAGMKKMVSKDFKTAAKTFDNTFSNIFPNFIAKANTAKDSNNPMTRILGNLFGLRVDKADSNIDTGKYIKTAIPFDGVTKQSIIEVIPSYLRKIESLLSGGDERLYDFKTGRWTTVKSVHAQHKQWREDHNKSMKGYLAQILKTGLGKDINKLFNKYDFQESFEKDLNAIATVLSNTGDLASLNNGEYGLNEELVDVFKTILGDTRGVKREFVGMGGKGRARYKTIIDPKKYQNNNMRMANKIAGIYAESNRARKRTQDEIEEDPLSLVRILYSEGIAGGDSYNGYRTKHGDLSKNVFDSPFAKAMLYVKDDYGHTLYEYLRHMKMDLTDIRNNSLSFFRRGKKKGNDTEYSRNLMDFEKSKYQKPDEYALDFHERSHYNGINRNRDRYNESVQATIQAYMDSLTNPESGSGKKKEPKYASEISDLNSMVFENITEQEMKERQKQLKGDDKKTVWDLLYENGFMKKEDRDKYNKVTYDSNKDMRTQMGELKGGVSKLALIGDYARQIAQKPWESATQALYKMDYWITSLFFGDDLKKTDPDKEDEERQGLFGIIKKKFTEGFDNLIEKITSKFSDVMDEKIRPWMKKFLSPIKNFLFGEREDSEGEFQGGLLSPFLNNVKSSLDKNTNDLKEYAKRLAEEAERAKDRALMTDDEIAEKKREKLRAIQKEEQTKNEARMKEMQKKRYKMDLIKQIHFNPELFTLLHNSLQDVKKYVDWGLSKKYDKDTILDPNILRNYLKYIINEGKPNKQFDSLQNYFELRAQKTRVKPKFKKIKDLIRYLTHYVGPDGNRAFSDDKEAMEYIIDRCNHFKYDKNNLTLDQMNNITSDSSIIFYINQKKQKERINSDDYQNKLQSIRAKRTIRSSSEASSEFIPELGSNEDDMFDLMEMNNKILTDKIGSPLQKAVDLLQKITDKITSIPNAGPLNARGGINKTGRPLQSVVSSGEIINGNVVPPGGPYLTTIPKGGVVINPADNATINKQARQEKSFLGRIRRNAGANDGLNTSGILNDKRTADVVVRGGIGGLIGLLLGHPLIGLGIGGSSALHKDNGTIANALFGDFIEIDENGKVQRKDNGLISQEIQDAVPDAKLGGLIGGIAGLFTPFGPVGGLLIGSALGFAKNNGLINETLFGESGLIKPDQVNKIKKALPRMGLGALAGAFVGPFGLVGNAILGASAGYVTTLDEFKDAIFGKLENGVRIGGLMGAIKKGAEPLKDFGKTMIDGLTNEIFGKKNNKGEREGGLFGMVKDHIVKPLGEGIKPMIQEGRLILRKGFKEIPKMINNILRDTVGEQLYARMVGGVTTLGKGALKAGKFATGVALSPFMAGAHVVKGIGGHFRRKQIRRGNADDMTAYERNRYRENSKWMGKYDDWSDIDSTLELFSANNSYEQLDELRRLVNFHTDREHALDKDEGNLRKKYSQVLEGNLHYKSTSRLMKAINSGKFDEAEKMLKTDNTIKNKDGTPLSPEQREYFLNKLNDLKNDKLALKGQYEAIAKSGKSASEELKKYGLDIDLTDENQVDKLSRYLEREVDHMKAGLTDEEKRKKLEQDPDNPLNKNTTGLQNLNESIQDLVQVMIGNKDKVRRKFQESEAIKSGDEEELRKIAIREYREETGIKKGRVKEEWIQQRIQEIKQRNSSGTAALDNDISKQIQESVEKRKKARQEEEKNRRKEALKKFAEIASMNWDKVKSDTIGPDQQPDANGMYNISIDGKVYSFTPETEEEIKKQYVKEYCQKKLGEGFKETIEEQNDGFFKKIFKKTSRIFSRIGPFKLAAGVALTAGLGGLPGIGAIAMANAPVIGGLALAGGAGWLATKGYKKFRTKEANENKLRKMAEKEYRKRMLNGEFNDSLSGKSEEEISKFRSEWIDQRMTDTRGKRFQGFFGGIKNKIAGSKENVDRLKDKASKSDKIVHAITKTLPDKIKDIYHKANDDDKEVPSILKKIFGITKWAIGVPLMVGFLNDSIVPFMKNKVRPLFLGEYNETTGEYEGGLASGIVNPLRKFFKEKFGVVHDWFHNEGKFTGENSGFRGMVNNLKGLGLYFFDKWKSGLSTILTTVLPVTIETLITNLPQIGGAIVTGLVDGIKGLLNQFFGNKKEFDGSNAVSASVSSNTADSIDLSGSNYGFNNTVGGAINVGKASDGTLNVKNAFNITAVNTSGGSSDTTHGETLSTPASRLGKHTLMAATNGNANAWRKGLNAAGGFVGKFGRGTGKVLNRFGLPGKVVGRVSETLGNAGEFILSGGTRDHSFQTNLKNSRKSILKNSRKQAKTKATKQAWDNITEYIKYNYADDLASGKTTEQILESIDDPNEIKKITNLAESAGKNVGLDVANEGIDKAKSRTLTGFADKVKNTKFGKTVGGGLNKITGAYNNLNNKVWDKVKDTGAGKAMKKVNDVSENLGKNIRSKTVDKVTDASKTWVTKAKDWIVKIFKKIFDSGPLKGIIKESKGKLSKEALEKTAKNASEKIAKETLEQATKGAAKGAAKGTVVTACAAVPVVGWIIDAVFIIYDFTTGMANWRNILQVNEAEGDWGDKLLAGLAKVMTNIPGLGIFVSEQMFATILIKFIGKVLFPKKSEELEEERAKAEQALAEYNAAHNTNITLEELNSKSSATSNWYTNLGKNVGNAMMDTFGGGDSALKEDLSETRFVAAASEKVEKIRGYAESIVGRVWNYYGKDYISDFADKATFTKLCSEVLDKITTLLNGLDEDQLETVEDHVTDIDGGIIDFRTNGKSAWKAGYNHAIEYLEMPKDTKATKLIKVVAALASIFVKSFGGVGLKPKVMGIVVSVIGKAFATAKDKEMQELITESDSKITEVNDAYNTSYNQTIARRDAYLKEKETDGGGGGNSRGSTTEEIATNAKANDKLSPISGKKVNNFTESIGMMLNQSIEKNLTGFDSIGKVIAKLVNKNKAINKKIDAVDLSPEDEKYWQIDVESKSNAFANAIFKFNEIMSRIIKAPFALVTKTMGSSNTVLASSVDSTTSSGSTGSSSGSSGSVASGSTSTKKQSGLSKLWSGVKNTTKKLFNWITGRGKDEEEYNESEFGRALDDMNDPFHIYQRAYTGSYQTKGDTERQTVADSACGPAAAASVLRMYGKKGSMKNAVKYALNNNYKEVNGGTYPEYFNDYLNKNGIKANKTSSDKEVVQNLVSGKPVILMGRDTGKSGKTPYGSKYAHYVVARGIDRNGNVIVEDSEDPKGSTRYSLKDTLAHSNIKITTSGRGKYGRANENASLSENFINTTAGVISGTTANIIASVVGSAGVNMGGTTNTRSGSSSSSSYTVISDASDPGDTEGRKKTIWNYFKTNGFSDNLAAGIMGNMQRESGFNPTISERASGVNCTKVEDLPHRDTSYNGTGMGFGLIQWSYAGGHACLYNWCTANNCDPNTLDGQLKWVVAQMKGTNIESATNQANASIFGVSGEGTMSYNWYLIKNRGGFEAFNSMSIDEVVTEFYDCVERGADRSGDITKSIGYANEIYNQFTNGTGRGFETLRKRVNDSYEKPFGHGRRGRGIYGRDGETTDTTSNTTTATETTDSITTDTTPTNTVTTNTSNTSGSKVSLISKFGNYVGDAFKAVYGPYWDALFGDEVQTNNNSNTINGTYASNPTDVIYAAAMVFEALGRTNTSFIYDSSCTTYFDLECADGTILKHERPDCSGMMSAVMHYMGYYTQRPAFSMKGQWGDGYHGEGFGTQDWSTATSINCIFNADGTISSDWVLMNFNPDDRRSGDIIVKDGHMDMYIWTDDSRGSWKFRGFNAGSSDGMKDSYELAKYYLQNNNWNGQSGASTIKDSDALKTIRYVGSGSGRGKSNLSKINKPRRGKMHKYSPNPSLVNRGDRGDTSYRSGRGFNKYSKFGYGKYGRDGETTDTTVAATTETTNTTSSTTPTTNTTVSTLNQNSTGSKVSLLSKFGSYVGDAFKAIYGPFWDALFGDEDTSSSNTGSMGNIAATDPGSLIYAAAMVFDAMGRANPNNVYTYNDFDITCRDGKIIKQVQCDCSGMMTGVMQYMGYYTKNPANCGVDEYGPNWIVSSFRNKSPLWRADGSDGLEDWKLMDFNESILQSGDMIITEGGGHIEMYVYTDSSGKLKGFNAGSGDSADTSSGAANSVGSGIRDSREFAGYYLDNGNWTDGMGATLSARGQIWRYVGATNNVVQTNNSTNSNEVSGSGGFGRGIQHGHGTTNKNTKVNKKNGKSYIASSINSSNSGIYRNHSLPTLKSSTSSRYTTTGRAANTSYNSNNNQNYYSQHGNDSVHDIITSQNNNDNFDSLLSVLEIIAENSAKTEQMVQLLSAIVTNTAMLGNLSPGESGTDKIKQLISQMRASNHTSGQAPISTLNNMMNEGSSIVNAVYSIAKS